MPDLRVIVDRTKCAREGICASLAPEVFDFDDEGLALVVAPGAADLDLVLEAAESCPQDAITVMGEETGDELAA